MCDAVNVVWNGSIVVQHPRADPTVENALSREQAGAVEVTNHCIEEVQAHIRTDQQPAVSGSCEKVKRYRSKVDQCHSSLAQTL